MEGGHGCPGSEHAEEDFAGGEAEGSILSLAEENHRMREEIERGGGDLWTKDDRPEDIADVMMAKLTVAKAERVARAILALVKIKKNAAPAASAETHHREATA